MTKMKFSDTQKS